MPTFFVRARKIGFCGQQGFVIIDAMLESVDKLARQRQKLFRNITRDSADSDVVVGQALSAGHLEEIHDHLALAQTVEKRRDRAEIERERPKEDQMRGNSVKLQHDHAQIFRALRDFNSGDPLGRQTEDFFGRHRSDIFKTIEHRNTLRVGAVLADLLDSAMEIADVRLGVLDDLAVHSQQQVEAHRALTGAAAPC